MRRTTRLLVSVALTGMWLSGVAVTASAGTATAAPAKAAAPVFIPAPTNRTQPTRASQNQWWKGLKGKAGASVKPAAAPVLTIGVDNVTPPGHNWEYTAFFPESNLSVPQGSVVDFHWNAASSPASLHTVTFLNSGQTEAQFRSANPFIVSDNSSGETGEGTIQNNNIYAPQFGSSPPCGFPAVPPAATPCTWNDNATVSSGAIPNGPGSGAPQDFQVLINAPAGVTYTYICAIHLNMRGTIHVTAPATTPTSQAAADAAAATQYDSLNALAGPREAADLTPTAPIVHPNGTKTWTEKLGDEIDDVQLLEMLPPTLAIAKGDTVNYVNGTTQEIHTATFATNATFPEVLPFGNPECEGAPPSSPDTPANPNMGPFQGCTTTFNPTVTALESPLNPAPLGEQTNITTGSTTGSSGILFPTQLPLPHSKAYTFPNNGNFSYFCIIHAGMFGAVYTSHYRAVASDGGEFTFGGADFFGSSGAVHLNSPIVGQAETPDAQGYWQVGADGGVFTFGDAGFFGSTGNIKLNQPVVGIAPTPDGGGYWEVASDGGVFAFGDAQFLGSTGNVKLNKPIVGIKATSTGGGYWLVASDGGVFNFGDAQFLDSLGGIQLNAPIVGITSSDDGGYTLVASDGGVFTFGDAGFFGSTGDVRLNKPIVGIALTIDGGGYWEVASDGGVFTFGSAKFFGSLGDIALNQPIIGLSGA